MMPVSNVEMATQKGAKRAKVISRAERNWDIGFKAVELVGFLNYVPMHNVDFVALCMMVHMTFHGGIVYCSCKDHNFEKLKL